LIGSATSGTDGKWIVVGTGYASDPHWYGAVATDLAGNVGQSTSDYTWEACLRLTGGSGNDVLVGGAGNDRLNGRAGADVMMGGTGNDLSYVDNAGDKVIEAVGGGSDTVYSTVSWSMASSQEVEYLRAYGAGATSGVTLAGNELKNYLIGGSGNDVLSGGAGGDILWGRGGANTFVYRAASESTSASPDNITDFHHGIDKIDFTNIAGIAASGGVPQFQGNLGSTGNVTLNARSVAYMEVGNNTLVLVNSSAAAETVSATDTHTADMKIVLTGVHLSLTASDLHHS
jgi:Ca2+-binding RTX toxin-like protein